MKKYIFFAVLTMALMLITSCEPEDPIKNPTSFQYPEKKLWAHRVNDIPSAQQKKELFAGIEVDLIYSDYQNKLFVAHDEVDTIQNLTFDAWLAALTNHKDSYYWIDMKNLSQENADKIALEIFSLAQKYGISNNLMIEHVDRKALKIIKNYGFHIIFWVDNYLWSGLDTATWRKKVVEEVKELNPDAISAASNIFPTLSNTFPARNIHYWNTPIDDYEKNVALTKEICRVPNVKVVLVDYDKPIDGANHYVFH